MISEGMMRCQKLGCSPSKGEKKLYFLAGIRRVMVFKSVEDSAYRLPGLAMATQEKPAGRVRSAALFSPRGSARHIAGHGISAR